MHSFYSDSFAFTAHSSLQKRAMDTKKSVCIVTTVKNEVCHAHKNVSIHTLYGEKCVYRWCAWHTFQFYKPTHYIYHASTQNLVHNKFFSLGNHTGVSGELHHN